MNTSASRGAAVRARNNRRLHRMTVGTAMAAVAATGAFGWIAAMTYHGSTATTTSAVRTTSDDGTTGEATTSDDGTIRAGVSNPGVTRVLPGITAVGGGGLVTSGGS